MRCRRLGRTELDVSEISLGTVELGLEYGFAESGKPQRPSFGDAEKVLQRALDLGINLLDTARAYGESEEIIGRALAHRRAEFHLVSKVQTFPNFAGDPRAQMRASIEESLRVLRTDRLDLLLLHSSTIEEIEQGAAAEVLLEARDKGLARYVGASVYGPEAARAAVECGHFDCIQIAWSLLDRRPEANVIPLASKKSVGVMVRSVLMRGALTHRRSHMPAGLEDVARAAAALERVATKAGISLPELAYRYILSHPGPWTALVGTASVAELEAGASFSERGPLPGDVISAVRRVELENPSLLDLSRWPS